MIPKKARTSAVCVRDRLVTWINRTITHPRDEEGDYGIRVVMHIPIGIIMGIPIIGFQLMSLFFFYQKNEDSWTSDQAWKDTAGALVGTVVTTIAFTGLGIWAIIHYRKGTICRWSRPATRRERPPNR